MVRFDFEIDLEYELLEPGDFIFMIHAAHTRQQKVVQESFVVAPEFSQRFERCHHFGNPHLSLHAEPGRLGVRYRATVDLNHHYVKPEELVEVNIAQMPLRVRHYVQPSRYCPSDRFYAIAVQEFGNLEPGYARVSAIANWVRERTTFKSGASNSSNCGMDTYNDRAGVCRDFSHLMIALCRALNIPARYVTAIDFGADPALGPTDFHAYVEVFLSDRWFIFDPTGICRNTALIRLATGRDANDVAFATMFGRMKWSPPKISMTNRNGDAAGFSPPADTTFAVSTDGPRDFVGTEMRATHRPIVTKPLHRAPVVVVPGPGNHPLSAGRD